MTQTVDKNLVQKLTTVSILSSSWTYSTSYIQYNSISQNPPSPSISTSWGKNLIFQRWGYMKIWGNIHSWRLQRSISSLNSKQKLHFTFNYISGFGIASLWNLPAKKKITCWHSEENWLRRLFSKEACFSSSRQTLNIYRRLNI